LQLIFRIDAPADPDGVSCDYDEWLRFGTLSLYIKDESADWLGLFNNNINVHIHDHCSFFPVAVKALYSYSKNEFEEALSELANFVINEQTRANNFDAKLFVNDLRDDPCMFIFPTEKDLNFAEVNVVSKLKNSNLNACRFVYAYRKEFINGICNGHLYYTDVHYGHHILVGQPKGKKGGLWQLQDLEGGFLKNNNSNDDPSLQAFKLAKSQKYHPFSYCGCYILNFDSTVIVNEKKINETVENTENLDKKAKTKKNNNKLEKNNNKNIKLNATNIPEVIMTNENKNFKWTATGNSMWPFNGLYAITD
jgi:hypothetical protein